MISNLLSFASVMQIQLIILIYNTSRGALASLLCKVSTYKQIYSRICHNRQP